MSWWRETKVNIHDELDRDGVTLGVWEGDHEKFLLNCVGLGRCAVIVEGLVFPVRHIDFGDFLYIQRSSKRRGGAIIERDISLISPMLGTRRKGDIRVYYPACSLVSEGRRRNYPYRNARCYSFVPNS